MKLIHVYDTFNVVVRFQEDIPERSLTEGIVFLIEEIETLKAAPECVYIQVIDTCVMRTDSHLAVEHVPQCLFTPISSLGYECICFCSILLAVRRSSSRNQKDSRQGDVHLTRINVDHKADITHRLPYRRWVEPSLSDTIRRQSREKKAKETALHQARCEEKYSYVLLKACRIHVFCLRSMTHTSKMRINKG